VTMTMSAATGEVQVLPLSLTMAEVRLATGGMGTSIGKVSSRNGSWFWQHRDGEQKVLHGFIIRRGRGDAAAGHKLFW